MRSAFVNQKLYTVLWSAGAFALASVAAGGPVAAQQAAARSAPAVSAEGLETFATPEQAADALIKAAEKFVGR